jgi:dTDP-4-amino-4,6-dideoxygalactose transaminase
MKLIPFLRPNLVKKEKYLSYLSKIDHSRIYSNYGPLNSLFEKRVLHEYFQNEGALVTVNNATTGLMLAISQSKRPKGRYALMPSFTFAATPLAAMWCGLEPYFIDIDPHSWCMDETILLDTIKKLKDKVAVVIPYATFGTCLDLSLYHSLHKSGIPVVVDAAPCFGTTSVDGQFGKGFGGTVVFSFHATKSFGIGEGGMVYSGKKEGIEKIRQASNFGFSGQRVSTLQGMNGKLSEYAAAIGLATLDLFPDKIKIRQRIYDFYLKQFDEAGLTRAGWTFQDSRGDIAHQFVPVLCPSRQNSKKYVKKFLKNSVDCRTYFSPACHHHPSFKSFRKTSLSVTEEIEKRILSLPLHEETTAQDVARVVRGIVQ